MFDQLFIRNSTQENYGYDMVAFLFFCIAFLSIQQPLQAQQTSYSKSKIDSLNRLDFSIITSNATEYEKVYHDVLRASDSLNYTNGKAGASVKLGLIYNVLGESDLRTESRLQAIRFYEEIDSLKLAGYQYAELGWGFRTTDMVKSVQYMRQGLRILSAFPGSSEQSSAFNNYGSLKLELQEYDSAFVFVNKSLRIKKALNDTIGIAYSFSYLSNIYQDIGDFDRAIDFLDSAITIRKTINDINGISIDLVNTGIAYQSIGQLETAKDYFKRSLASALEIGYVALAEFAYNSISGTFEQLGMSDSALVYYKSYTQYKDSILNIETSKRVAELEIQFKTEEQEKELAQKTAALSIEQLRVKRRNWFAGIFGTLFFSVCFISFLYFRQQKIKRESLERENELKLKLADMELKNKIHKERERISRDLHDNVGSQITNLITGLEISNLHIKKNQQKKALSLLENLDLDARGAMTDLRETIWLLDKEEVHFEVFFEHLKGYIKRQKNYLKDMKVEITSEIVQNIILNPTQSLNLTRIIQEGLNNARKYSQASLFEISFLKKDSNIIVKLFDNGIGMDVDSALSEGNGLRNIRERVQELNGQLTLVSEPGKGTSYSIEL